MAFSYNIFTKEHFYCYLLIYWNIYFFKLFVYLQMQQTMQPPKWTLKVMYDEVELSW